VHQELVAPAPANPGKKKARAGINRKNKQMRIALIILGIIAIILIAARIYLPFFIEDQINRNINEMEGMSGGVENVSLGIIRGNARLSDLAIYNEEYPDPSTPFVTVASTDISVNWRALFNRKLVARVDLDSVVVNYVIFEEVEPEEVDIVEMLRELMDFQVDLNITNSKVNFADITTDPPVEVSFNDINTSARYLTNEIYSNDTLPAIITLSAAVMGTGSISAGLGINYMKEIPDFELELELENVDLTDFNEFAREYGGFAMESGVLHLYTESAANEGFLKGYMKPLLDDINIGSDDPDLLKEFYEAALDVTASLLESPDEGYVATRVEFEGKIDDPEVRVMGAIWNLLRNAFIDGFSRGIENAIDFEDLLD
jgi:hypothetical protein